MKLYHLALFLLFHTLVAIAQTENFESFDDGHSILKTEGWAGFQGFRGEKPPSVTVVAGKGVDGSKAVAISSAEPFRGDNFGLRYALPESCENGVVWLQCQFKPPTNWTAGLFFDARGPKNERLGRISAAPRKDPATQEDQLRWHCSWRVPHYRLYTSSEMDPNRWYTATARFDLDKKMYAAWVDDQPLGEEAPMTGKAALSQIHLSISGSPETPAFVDNLVVSRETPKGFQAPELLPEPEEGMLFRFAGLGDPQLGFGGYDADKVRFSLAIDQINRTGSELSVILGDMVHFNDNIQAFEDMVKLAEDFESPHYYVRGNHEKLELFQKYFHKEINYSIVHKGVRFVMIDAIGNHAGLGEEQLGWIESEFSAASKANEEIVISLHVSPWQNNKKGIGQYNQIGPGRGELRALMKEHKVLLCLSGHYHTGLLHGLEEETHYLVLGGTALVKAGTFAWCLFEVYPDRIVMYQKPLFFGYEKPGVAQVHGLQGWIPYEKLREVRPSTQQGPLTMKRHRPAR